MSEKEYIERGALLMTPPFTKYGGDLSKYTEGYLDCAEEARNAVNDAPAADVVEVGHGSWIFEHDPIKDPKKYFIRIVCSCCGLKTSEVSNFCPMCGAKMDGERKENP